MRFVHILIRPYERRGRDGGELRGVDRFLIERSGFEGFGAVDRDRGHLVVGVDYVERQRGVEVGRDVEEGFDVVAARRIGRVLQCDDVRLVGCAEAGNCLGTPVFEAEIEARSRKLLGFPAGGQQQVFHLVGRRGDGEIEDRREAVQREGDVFAVGLARLVVSGVCPGGGDQRVVGAVEIVARLRAQVPEREVGRGAGDLRVGEEGIVIAAARCEIVERTFECGRGGVVVEFGSRGRCRAAGFDRQDAQGVASFPFGREGTFADMDVGAGAVVFGDLGIDFNKRTVAGVRGGVRFVELVAAGQRCEGRCTEEEFEGFFHGAEVLGFVGFVHVTVVIGHRKNTPAYR